MDALEELQKECAKCKILKPVSEFYFRKDSGKYRAACKKCKSINTKEEIIARVSSPTKICKHCNIEKPVSEYQKAGGGKTYQPYCKICDSARKKEWYKKNKESQSEKNKKRYKDKIEKNPNFHAENYAKNRDKFLERNKKQVAKYRDRINERNREYRKLEKYKIKSSERAKERVKQKIAENPEYFKILYQKKKQNLDSQEKRDEYNEKQRLFKAKYPDRYKNYTLSDWAKENKKVRNREWCKTKRKTDICFRIACNIRNRTRLALKRAGAVKADKLIESMLGCSISYFKDYFCSLFTEGMNWEEFMSGKVHIDHIKPCISFDLTKESEQRACFFYKNLQPLWAVDNLKKGKKYNI